MARASCWRWLIRTISILLCNGTRLWIAADMAAHRYMRFSILNGHPGAVPEVCVEAKERVEEFRTRAARAGRAVEAVGRAARPAGRARAGGSRGTRHQHHLSARRE